MKALELPDLHDFEREALLAALRRDMRSEEEKARGTDGYAYEHAFNAREDRRLLETLNPKARSLRTSHVGLPVTEMCDSI